MRRLGHLCICSLFLAFIYVPLILSLATKDQGFSPAEKRRLAKLPRFEFTLAALQKFPAQMEAYCNDHFGLREQMVAFYNYLYFNILEKSPLPLVTVGRDGWLFYNGEGVMFDYLGLLRYSEEQLESWKRVLEDREEWLEELDIKYLCVVAPNKRAIYPEKLPARVQKKEGVPLLEQFTAYLQEHSTARSFVNLQDVLLAAKKNAQVYYRLDTHWNPDGALVGYRSIMARIRQWFPEVQEIPAQSLKKKPEIRGGDIRVMFNLGSLPPENASRWDVEPACSSKNSSRVDLKNIRYSRYQPTRNGCPGRPLSVLLIQDSFGQFLHTFFNETFGEVLYSNLDLKDVKELLNLKKPQVIIDLRVARHLPGMLEADPEVERHILEKHYPLSTDVRLRLDAGSWQDKLGATHELTARPGKGGVVLQATGIDPSVELSFAANPEQEKGPLLVRMSLFSPADTVMQIYYTTPESPEFSKERMLSRNLKRGNNDLLFRLPHPRTAGKIRLDPGMVPGEYLLKSLVIAKEGGK